MSNYCTVQNSNIAYNVSLCLRGSTVGGNHGGPNYESTYRCHVRYTSCHRTGPLNRTSFLPPAPETVLYECHWMTPHWTIHILLILNVETSFSLLYSNHYIENYKLYDYWIWESNWQVANNNNNVISSHFIHRTILQTGLKIEGKFKGVSFLDWHMLNGCQVCNWSIQ